MRLLSHVIVVMMLGSSAVLCQSDSSGCPVFSIVGPETGVLTPESEYSFHAQFSLNAPKDKVNFIWASSGGRIMSGYGSPKIQLRPEREDGGSNLHIFVKVEGLSRTCENYASEIFPVAPIPEEEPLDEFGTTTGDPLRARVDNFFIQINNNPRADGVSEIWFGEKESNFQRTRRIRDILKAVRYRDYDMSRLSFVVMERPAIRPRTVFWLLNPGAVPRKWKNEHYSIFKAVDLIKNPRKAISETYCHCK